jgi:hypothetical protein
VKNTNYEVPHYVIGQVLYERLTTHCHQDIMARFTPVHAPWFSVHEQKDGQLMNTARGPRVAVVQCKSFSDSYQFVWTLCNLSSWYGLVVGGNLVWFLCGCLLDKCISWGGFMEIRPFVHTAYVQQRWRTCLHLHFTTSRLAPQNVNILPLPTLSLVTLKVQFVPILGWILLLK